MCCRCCSVKQQKIWTFSVGSVFAIFGVILITAWPTIYRELLNSMLPLTPDSFLFSNWIITPIPVYLNVYLYNWTNPHMANNASVKPHFEEMGPYVFRETRIKEDLKWDNKNNLVTYFARRNWYFEASKSNGSLNDMITSPHLPTVGASKIFRPWHPILRKIINFALNREGGKLTMTHPVINSVFNGAYDHIMDFAERLHSPFLGVNDNHFGYFYNRNNSKEADGLFSMHTGKKDLSQLGDLKFWNGISHTKYWKGECGRVNGTTGDIWSPHKNWQEPVSLFLPEISRYINIYPRTKESYRGVNVWHYTTTKLTFDSGYIAEDTKCFCVPGRECPKNGVNDISPITYRAPLYLSHPHFYMTDPLYRENTTGLKPDPKKHAFDILLEPKLAVPLRIRGGAFLSAYVERDEKIDILKDLAWNFYAPLFWAQMEVDLSDDFLRLIKLNLSLPSIGQYIGIVFTIIGLIMIGIGIYMTKKQKLHVQTYEKDKTNQIMK